MEDTLVTAADAEAIRAEARQRAQPVIDWMLESRLERMRSTLRFDQFCRALIEAGVPLDRSNLGILQLHPELRARSMVWSRESGGAIEVGLEHGIEESDRYLDSPIRRIYDGKGPLRRRLCDPDCPIDFPILTDLLSQSFTDYAVYPLPFGTGRINAMGFATKQDHGFALEHLALIEATLPALASVMESRHVLRTARLLLDTYVGPDTGRRILSGTIRRGDASQINAAIWTCDLRGFTELIERLPADEMMTLLNGYFDCMARPIEARGGEILKFVGDALLAIFPCEKTPEAERKACDAALEAAEQALADFGALNEARQAEGEPPLGCGIAINLGDVMYGNIGGGKRLDFTVIGPAVNLAARLESLTAKLQRPILVSEAVAKAAGRDFESQGRFALKGIAGEQPAYAPRPAVATDQSRAS